MRSLLLLAAMAVLGGCDAPLGGAATGGQTANAPSAGPYASAPKNRLMRWEQEWQAAKREVVVARQQAVAARRPIAAEVDAEVTALLERDLQSDDPEVRIQNLQDAVDDALRLAELVSLG